MTIRWLEFVPNAHLIWGIMLASCISMVDWTWVNRNPLLSFPRDIRPIAALLMTKPGMARVRKHLSLFLHSLIHSRGASRRLKLRRNYRKYDKAEWEVQYDREWVPDSRQVRVRLTQKRIHEFTLHSQKQKNCNPYVQYPHTPTALACDKMEEQSLLGVTYNYTTFWGTNWQLHFSRIYRIR